MTIFSWPTLLNYVAFRLVWKIFHINFVTFLADIKRCFWSFCSWVKEKWWRNDEPESLCFSLNKSSLVSIASWLSSSLYFIKVASSAVDSFDFATYSSSTFLQSIFSLLIGTADVLDFSLRLTNGGRDKLRSWRSEGKKVKSL